MAETSGNDQIKVVSQTSSVSQTSTAPQSSTAPQTKAIPIEEFTMAHFKDYRNVMLSGDKCLDSKFDEDLNFRYIFDIRDKIEHSEYCLCIIQLELARNGFVEIFNEDQHETSFRISGYPTTSMSKNIYLVFDKLLRLAGYSSRLIDCFSFTMRHYERSNQDKSNE